MNIQFTIFRQLSPDRIFLMLILIMAMILNLQFLDGSNVNFLMSGHDEYIAVREVYIILNPLSYKHFFMAIISGDVLYYGRIMFYLDALLTYLPFKIFGLPGLVYAIRMVHVVYMFSGLVILGQTFLNNWKYRLLFYIGTLTLYYSFYFYMVPKPDPLQLLTLSVFFYYFRKNSFRFGKYFILLGIAYGIKFSVLTLLPWILIIPLLSRETPFIPTLKTLFISVLYFIAGLLIAIPCLILSPIKPVFLKSYYNSTFGYVEQYDDDMGQTKWDWISKGWFGAFNGGVTFGILLVILILLVLFVTIRKYAEKGEIRVELILLVSGLFLFIPVLMLTNRIWPHYLWTGYLFIFLAIVIFIQNQEQVAAFRILTIILVLIVVSGSLKCTYAQGNQLFNLQNNAKQLLENGNRAYSYLKKERVDFTAVQDISVPYPFKEMLKTRIYHPFASELTDTVSQKFISHGFISPEIIADINADYILTYKIDFNDSAGNLRTSKDAMLMRNNSLIRKELGKTIFFDTAFGKIKIYKVIKSK